MITPSSGQDRFARWLGRVELRLRELLSQSWVLGVLFVLWLFFLFHLFPVLGSGFPFDLNTGDSQGSWRLQGAVLREVARQDPYFGELAAARLPVLDMEALAREGDDLGREVLGLDFLFALVTGLMGAAVVAVGTLRLRRHLRNQGWDRSSISARRLDGLFRAPLVAVGFDWAENLMHLEMLRRAGEGGGGADLPGMLVCFSVFATMLKILLYVLPVVVAIWLWYSNRGLTISFPEDAGSEWYQGLDKVIEDESGYVRGRRLVAAQQIRRRCTADPSQSAGTCGSLNDLLSELELPKLTEGGQPLNPKGATRDGDGGQEPGDLVGLALSGGGIRSATFGLGVLQGLARIGILPFVDYVSSVSGGGFSAGSLTSLLTARYRTVDTNLPLFSTLWRYFPLNPGIEAFRWGAHNKRAYVSVDRVRDGRNVQLTHQRDMGSFLTPRRGPVGRDMLRGIGMLAGGMLYTLGMFGLVAFMVAGTLYLATVALAPGVSKPVEEALVYEGLGSMVAKSLTYRGLGATGWSPSFSFLVAFLFGICFVVVPIALLWRRHDRRGDDIHADRDGEALEGRTAPERADVRDLSVYRLALLAWLIVSTGLIKLRVTDTVAAGHVIWVWLPTVIVLGAGIYLALGRFFGLSVRDQPIWSEPGIRNMVWAFQGVTLYVFGGLIVLTALALPHFFRMTSPTENPVTEPLAVAIVSAALSGLLALVNEKSAPGDTGRLQKLLRLSRGLRNALLGLLVIVFLLANLFLIQMFFDLWLAQRQITIPWFGMELGGSILVLWAVFLAAALLMATGRLVNLNYMSLNYFWRDRVVDAFLRTEIDTGTGDVREARNDWACELMHVNGLDARGLGTCDAPYHLIVAATNLTDSWRRRHKDRLSEPFVFSRLFCGGRTLGYVRTEDTGFARTRLSRALAISGAAVSSAVGHMSFFAQAFVVSLLNLRLGLWVSNPREYDVERSGRHYGREEPEERAGRLRTLEESAFWPWYLLDEFRGRFSERRPLVNLTDGGHTGDNGGLYPLFERRCRFIIAADASRDREFRCTDLYRVIRQVDIDLGIKVEIKVDGLKPDFDAHVRGPHGKQLSRRHGAIGRIQYPGDPVKGTEPTTGWLIYLKPAVTLDDAGRLVQYFENHEGFPQQSTADMDFDEYQYEAQRLLGEESVLRTFRHVLRRRAGHDGVRAPWLKHDFETWVTEEMADALEIELAAWARAGVDSVPWPALREGDATVRPARRAAVWRLLAPIAEEEMKVQGSRDASKSSRERQPGETRGQAVARPPENPALRSAAESLAGKLVELQGGGGDWEPAEVDLEGHLESTRGERGGRDAFPEGRPEGAELQDWLCRRWRVTLEEIEFSWLLEREAGFVELGVYPFGSNILTELEAELAAATPGDGTQEEV